MVLSLDRWISAKAVAVVTGTSSGIGAAIAELLVKEGLTVVGIARRVDRVEALAKKLEGEKGKLVPLKADISKEDDVVKAFEWIKNNVGPVSILINNAAVFHTTKGGSVLNGDYKSWKDVLETNVLGVSLCTREAVKQMKANNIKGHIIHINSGLGHKVANIPNGATYIASKWSVRALTESQRHELRNENLKIKVTSVSPGLTETEGVLPGLKADNPTKPPHLNFQWLEPKDVAEGVYYVLSTPEHVQVQELLLKSIEQMEA